MIPPLDKMPDRDREEFKHQLDAIVDTRINLGAGIVTIGVLFHLACLGFSTGNWFIIAGCVVAVFLLWACYATLLTTFFWKTRWRDADRVTPTPDHHFSGVFDLLAPFSLLILVAPSFLSFLDLLSLKLLVAACIHSVAVGFLITTGRKIEEQAWCAALGETRQNELPDDPDAHRLTRYPFGRTATKLALFVARISSRTPTLAFLALQLLAGLGLWVSFLLERSSVAYAVLPSLALYLFVWFFVTGRTAWNQAVQWCQCIQVVAIGIALGRWADGDISGTTALALVCVTTGIGGAVIAWTLKAHPSTWWSKRLSTIVLFLLGQEFVGTPEATAFRRCLWFCMLGSRHHQRAFVDEFCQWLNGARASANEADAIDVCSTIPLSALMTAAARMQLKDVIKYGESRAWLDQLFRSLSSAIRRL